MTTTRPHHFRRVKRKTFSKDEKKFTPSDFRDAYASAVTEVFEISEQPPGENESKAAPISWLLKKTLTEQDADTETIDYHNSTAQTEVFSAWCYEAFIGNGTTQPTYKLVEDKDNQQYIATKKIENYKNIRQLVEECDDPTTLAQTLILSNADNTHRLAQMLVTWIWLAARDFKTDHLGINNRGELVCLDFRESLVPLLPYVRESLIPYPYEKIKGVCTISSEISHWNFSIDYHDIEQAPRFQTYNAGITFIDQLGRVEDFKGFLDALAESTNFRNAIFSAVLKRIIFPKEIDFVGLEIFGDSITTETVRWYLINRTLDLRNVMLSSTQFLSFLETSGNEALLRINSEVEELIKSKPEVDTFNFQAVISQMECNYRNLLAQVRLIKSQPTANDMLAKLINFCLNQYHKLVKKKDDYFKKGVSDKASLFLTLVDKVNNIYLGLIDLSSTERSNQVTDLIRETAIIAHHCRYSKLNTLLFQKSSDSWQSFTQVFGEEKESPYTDSIKLIITNKKDREITLKRPGSDPVRIGSYNPYRSFISQATESKDHKSTNEAKQAYTNASNQISPSSSTSR